MSNEEIISKVCKPMQEAGMRLLGYHDVGNAVNSAIIIAKKEVYEELIAKSYDFNEHKLPLEEIRESMKRHLSTFENKSDIIAVKKQTAVRLLSK
jgi:hypothetical protein